jgi:hypothetical protein
MEGEKGGCSVVLFVRPVEASHKCTQGRGKVPRFVLESRGIWWHEKRAGEERERGISRKRGIGGTAGFHTRDVGSGMREGADAGVR